MMHISKKRNKRPGAAVVELAICLPVMVLLVWGTIETSGAIFLKQALTSAAHEGALAGMRLNATEEVVRGRVEMILESRDLTECTVAITPSGTDFEEMEPGDNFSISISKGSQNKFINITSVSVTINSQRP